MWKMVLLPSGRDEVSWVCSPSGDPVPGASDTSMIEGWAQSSTNLGPRVESWEIGGQASECCTFVASSCLLKRLPLAN
eukprot:CAMPEP_0173316212 /NCGR_PEP_ID=MMETSP1143-20121109/26376_1 /TAXON_ID=483371 /ORGANISM="non described non described, Strain CCMP2298" /LENGTH=77 /DNA_ID=CAMNT_0014259121 /DNA_START=489 /DNA_END=719 /DNA_ORIENTATION=+